MTIERIAFGKVAVGPVLARGRQSVVHAGRMLATREAVALKIGGGAFHAHAALRMRSEHAVRVIDAGPGWIAMERLYGMLLANCDAPGSVSRAAEIGLQVCEAVAEAHALGIVHGDLGPHRVFLLHGSNSIRVLGFARPSAGGDSRIDVYGIGTILQALARGSHPSPPFEATVRRCLASNPDDRFQTIEELAETLARFAPPHAVPYLGRVRRAGSTPSGGVMIVEDARPALDPPSASKPSRVVGCFAFVVAAAAIALFAFSRPKPPPAPLFAAAVAPPPPTPIVSALPTQIASAPSAAPTMPRPKKPHARRAR